MRLLFVTDGIMPFTVGGMQKHSQQLAMQLALLGHSVTLVHCIYGSKPLPTSSEVANCFGEDAMKNLEVISLRFPTKGKFPGHYLYESYAYSKNVYNKLKDRLNEFDFIYTKGFAGWYFIEQKQKNKKLPPISVKFHGYEMFQKPSGLKMWMQNKLLQKPVIWNNSHADYIFSYGGGISQLIRKLGQPENKIIEIPTGIDQSWIIPGEPKTTSGIIRFCFVGRYERRKGIEEIHLALKQLDPQDYQFDFVGPIPPLKQIKSGNIRYHGSVTESRRMQDILDTCDVLVVPSHSEGMPNVIMEGMARGLAILTTRVGAIESVVKEDNGWFVEPGNVTDLIACMKTIINCDRGIISDKKICSVQMIRSFSWNHIAAITAEKIEAILQ